MNPDEAKDERENVQLTRYLLVAMVSSTIILAVALIYLAVSVNNNHQSACARTDLALDAVASIVSFSLQPKPHETYTAKQLHSIARFQTQTNLILDRARC